ASASDPCTNINECTASPRICSIHSTCNDSDGSFLCTCGFGFRKLTATICEHQLCSNITCAPGLICSEDMQTGIGMCGCRGNQHLFNNTRCLPKFPFVQRTIKAFREEYNNLTSPVTLAFIAEFVRTEL
uniref:EGF-like domain-containing protein n=1 Tax=Ciona savignyi TaxID=51511 RepID=H2Y5S9_CIOSA